MTQSLIQINNLKVHTIVGLLSFERETKQDLFIDISMRVNFEDDGLSDTLINSPDYAEVAEKFALWVQVGKFELIESIGVQGGLFLLDLYKSLVDVKISVRKPAAISGANSAEIIYLSKRK
jgi:FolB domain-containing protein